LRQISRWMGIHRGIVRRPGMNGRNISRSVARNILTQHAMDEFNDGEISPGASVQTDEEILDWVAKDAETAMHPSCSLCGWAWTRCRW
jgi:choline dehydrogenase-like flavoprotein